MLVLWGASGLGRAATEAAPMSVADSFVVIQLDNDLFTGSDRDYTNGIRIAALNTVAESSVNDLQGGLLRLGEKLDSSVLGWLGTQLDPATQYEVGTGLAQLMFTPEDPFAPAAPPGQRPYAGWLGIEYSVHAKNAETLSSMMLTVGLTGEAAWAEKAQDLVHRHISGSPLFRGWDSQVPEEVTLNLHLDHKRYLGQSAEDGLMFDGYWEWGGALGNFRTDLYTGALFRAGWNLPVQYVAPRIQLGSYSHEFFDRSPARSGREWSVYVMAGGRGTWVVHDITLDGPLYRDYAGAVSSKSLVGEVLVGVGFRFRQLTFSVARLYRTAEFGGQDGGHRFGSVQLGARF